MSAAAKALVPPPLPRRSDPAYYQALHDSSPDYQQKNWLVDELPTLRAVGGESLVEMGCGNGLFLAQAAQHWDDVTGIDWARSPVLDGVLREHPRIRFVQQDVTQLQLDRHYDLLVSADFLEHLPPEVLPALIARMHAGATVCWHKIACYDDGHSHLSIFDARRWLRLFERAAPGAGYRIVSQSFRKPPRKKAVVVISNVGGSARTSACSDRRL